MKKLKFQDTLQPYRQRPARPTHRQSCYAPHHSIAQVHAEEALPGQQDRHHLRLRLPHHVRPGSVEEWRRFEQTDPKSYRQLLERMPTRMQAALRDGEYKCFAQAYEMLLAEEEGEIEVCRDEAELHARAEKGITIGGRWLGRWSCSRRTRHRAGRWVVISNDITFQMGSFSMREHRLYAKVSSWTVLVGGEFWGLGIFKIQNFKNRFPLYF